MNYSKQRKCISLSILGDKISHLPQIRHGNTKSKEFYVGLLMSYSALLNDLTNKFLLTSATERPRSSMIPLSAGDEYPTYKNNQKIASLNVFKLVPLGTQLSGTVRIRWTLVRGQQCSNFHSTKVNGTKKTVRWQIRKIYWSWYQSKQILGRLWE